MKKLLIILSLVLVLLPLNNLRVQAYTDYNLAYDNTDLFDGDYLTELGERSLVQLSDMNSVEYRLDIMDDLGDYTIAELAQGFYDSYGYGYEETGDSIYLMLVVDNLEDDVEFSDFIVIANGQHKAQLDPIAQTLNETLIDYLNYETFSGDIDEDNYALQEAMDMFMQTIMEADYTSSSGGLTLPTVPEKDKVETSFIFDEAGLLTVDEINSLEAKAQAISDEYRSGVYVATVKDMTAYGYRNIEDFSEYFFREHNLGLNEDNDGVLLILSMADRDYDLTAHGVIANAAFTDYGKDLLVDKFLDNFRNNDWYGGFKDYIYECDKYYLAEANGKPIDIYKQPKEPVSPFKAILDGLGLGAIPALIAAFGRSAALKGQLKKTGLKSGASEYVGRGDVHFTKRQNIFVRRTETRRTIEKPKSSSGGGGTTINSSGHSHRSGKF